LGGVTATAPSRDLTDNKKKRREGSSRGESKRKLLKETQNQRKETYPSALSTEKTRGLYIVKKLPSDHLHQTPQGPQDKTNIPDPPQGSDEATRHSSSPNLIRRVQD